MIGLYDGIFGGGVSIFIILLFVFKAGHDYLMAVGTSKVPNIILQRNARLSTEAKNASIFGRAYCAAGPSTVFTDA